MRMKIFVLVMCFPILLTACREKPRKSIIGKWEQAPRAGMFTRVSVSGPGVMKFEFRNDGTLITQGGVQAVATSLDGTVDKQGGSTPETHGYTFLDDDTIRISFAKGPLFNDREVTMKITVSGNHMTLTETTPSGLQFVKDGTITLQRVE